MKRHPLAFPVWQPYAASAILVGLLAVLCLQEPSPTIEEISQEQLLNSSISNLRVLMDEHTPTECLRGAALVLNGRYNEAEPLMKDYGTCIRIAVRAATEQ